MVSGRSGEAGCFRVGVEQERREREGGVRAGGEGERERRQARVWCQVAVPPPGERSALHHVATPPPRARLENSSSKSQSKPAKQRPTEPFSTVFALRPRLSRRRATPQRHLPRRGARARPLSPGREPVATASKPSLRPKRRQPHFTTANTTMASLQQTLI